MHIGSAVSTPHQHSSVRASNLTRSLSPLNPLSRVRASSQTLKKSSQTQKPSNSILTHLLKLEHLLQKPAPAPSPLPPSPHQGTSGDSTTSGPSWGFLNLSGILPARRKAEEMSPRSLNRLQRLLSDTPRQSPRNYIGGQWRQLHGADDWSGLLDPLDQNLRRELIRYGEFVQAAYQAFHSNPAFNGSPESTRQVDLPDRNYKVTKSLYATSSIEMPKWVDGLVPPWMKQRSSWIGYVAVCENEREIQRMGRRDIVISLRGTATCLEWAENFRDLLVNIPEAAAGDQVTASTTHVQPKVECGFWSLFKTRSEHVPSLSEAVVEEVLRLMETYKGEQLSITVTGHSLGAALGLLVADELSTCSPNMPPVAVFSFGGPRVGNRGFTGRVEGKGVKVLRVVNEQDMVTRVPGVFVSEEVDRRLRGEWSHVLDAVDGVMPWAYAHVGKELRVDTRLSPYLKPNADPGCCHDLEAYLHLVDGFLGSHRPFRSNAKRSILRLMCQQGSNMKKLYTSKALTLTKEEVSGVSTCLPSPSSS